MYLLFMAAKEESPRNSTRRYKQQTPKLEQEIKYSASRFAITCLLVFHQKSNYFALIGEILCEN